jgi:excisionase family DNA binding protein
MALTSNEIKSLFDDPDWKSKYPPLLTVCQAAELAGVSKHTVYGWLSQGLLDDCRSKTRRPVQIHRGKYLEIIFNRGVYDDN